MAHIDIPVPLRWSDLDAYGHVNNAALLTLLEEARIHAFWEVPQEQLGGGTEQSPIVLPVSADGRDLLTFVASNRIEYLKPVEYRRDGAVVRLWISRLGGASLTVDYTLHTPGRMDEALIRARTVVVLVDSTGRPVRIGDDMRERLAPWMGEPLTFRD